MDLMISSVFIMALSLNSVSLVFIVASSLPWTELPLMLTSVAPWSMAASCMPLSGADCLAEWSQAAYWDEQHEHLSQLLYLTLMSKDVIKTTAPITLDIINRHSQYSNGFVVLQALIRRHYPRVTLSMAPAFAQCFTLRPILQLAKGSHPAYLSLFERWMFEPGIRDHAQAFTVLYLVHSRLVSTPPCSTEDSRLNSHVFSSPSSSYPSGTKPSSGNGSC
jgi:hypothetical protein